MKLLLIKLYICPEIDRFGFTQNYLLRMRNETTSSSSSILQALNSEVQLIRQTHSSSSTQYVRQNRLDYSNNSLQQTQQITLSIL